MHTFWIRKPDGHAISFPTAEALGHHLLGLIVRDAPERADELQGMSAREFTPQELLILAREAQVPVKIPGHYWLTPSTYNPKPRTPSQSLQRALDLLERGKALQEEAFELLRQIGGRTVATIAVLSLATACCRPCESTKPPWTPEGAACGVWALDGRNPDGAQLWTRSWDIDPLDGYGYAGHVIDMERIDRHGRQTAIHLSTLPAGPDGQAIAPCGAWVDPSVLQRTEYRDLTRGPGAYTRASGTIPTTDVPRFRVGDVLFLRVRWAADSLRGVRAAYYEGVTPASYHPCKSLFQP